MSGRIRGTSTTWYGALFMLGGAFSIMGGMFFLAGALGVFDDPTSSRPWYAVIAVVLFGLFFAFNQLFRRWGSSTQR